MILWGVLAFIVAIIAGVFGFSGIAGSTAVLAETVFGIGLSVFIISLFVGHRRV